MKKSIILLLSSVLLLNTACQNLADILPSELSEAEIVAGLKNALTVGADSSVATTSKLDGYLKDATIKLLLPQEASTLISNLKSVPGGETLYNLSIKIIEDNLITSLNRSAEDAAKTAKPILFKAVTDITIADGKKILFDGIDTAASNYLRVKTFTSLQAAYSPSIDLSLNKPLVLGKSSNEYWALFTTAYNAIATNPLNILLGLKPLKTQTLGSYATEKALDGLFIKIKAEEIAIRKDPKARVTEILVKVFGKLDK